MSILIENNKLRAFISKGPEQDIEVYSQAIHAFIDFYLCRDPFLPINPDQAGNIYFLKWIEKCLKWEPSEKSEVPGRIICEIPKQDISLLESFISSIDNAFQDVFSYGSENGLDKYLIDKVYFLNLLRMALSPNLNDIQDQVRKTMLN